MKQSSIYFLISLIASLLIGLFNLSYLAFLDSWSIFTAFMLIIGAYISLARRGYFSLISYGFKAFMPKQEVHSYKEYLEERELIKELHPLLLAGGVGVVICIVLSVLY